MNLKKLLTKRLRQIGYILVPIGILGYMLIIPPLGQPRNPSEHFWFWYNLRTNVAYLFGYLAIIGVESIILGIINEGIFYIVKKVKEQFK